MRKLAVNPFTNEIIISGLNHKSESRTVPSSPNYPTENPYMFVVYTSEAIYVDDKINYPIIVTIDSKRCVEVESTPTDTYQYRVVKSNSCLLNMVELHYSAANKQVSIQYYGYGVVLMPSKVLYVRDLLTDVDATSARNNLSIYSRQEVDNLFFPTKRIIDFEFAKLSSNSLTFSPGICLSDDIYSDYSFNNVKRIKRGGFNISKYLSLQFSEGDGGGLLYPSQTYNNYGRYLLYVILKNNGYVDYAACSDTVTFSLPPNYVAKRLIGAIILNNGIPDFFFDKETRTIVYNTPLTYIASMTSLDTEYSSWLLPSGCTILADIVFSPGVPQSSGSTDVYMLRGSLELYGGSSASTRSFLEVQQRHAFLTATNGTHINTRNFYNVSNCRILTRNGRIYTWKRSSGTGMYADSTLESKYMIMRYTILD